jgi:hypothetical protein
MRIWLREWFSKVRNGQIDQRENHERQNHITQATGRALMPWRVTDATTEGTRFRDQSKMAIWKEEDVMKHVSQTECVH